ncbi:hypothetical protein V8D89_005302 [Ganoderma adspersum]
MLAASAWQCCAQHLFACQNAGFILHELLSLFSVDTLVPAAHGISQFFNHPKSLKCVNALFPSASLTVRQLVLHQTDNHFYKFIERVLVPGCLRGLSTGTWSLCGGITDTLAWFLRSPATQNLVSISIGSIELYCLCDPPSWVVAASLGNSSVCRAILGAALACCTRLQYVWIGLVHRSHVEKDPLMQCSGLWTPLLANLAPTVRALGLHVWVLYWHSEGTIRESSEMHEREEVGLELAAAMALLRLSAAGLLKEFRVDDVEGTGSPDYGSDLYWPTEV